jgi:hypothetical protein
MVHMVEWGGVVKMTCLKDTKMVMFSHIHYFNDLVPSKWVHFYLWLLFFSCMYICFWGPICHKAFISFVHLFLKSIFTCFKMCLTLFLCQVLTCAYTILWINNYGQNSLHRWKNRIISSQNNYLFKLHELLKHVSSTWGSQQTIDLSLT